MESHKDQMKWLKENDPITYYELTSNPTGSDSDDGGEVFLILIIFIGIISLGYFIFCGK